MQHPAHAYAKIAQATQSPRELEASILLRAATRIQAIREDWDGRSGELGEALTYNRKLWTVLVTAATREENPLPAGIKQNIANLAIFIFNHTIATLSDPRPEKLGVLVNINRELAAGLRGMAPQPAG